MQKRRKKQSSTERNGSALNAAKQFLEEVKMEEREERSLADGNTCDDDDKGDMEKDTVIPAIADSIENEQPDLTEGSVTCNQVDEDGQLDPNKGSVTCSQVDEGRQVDSNKGSVTCNEIVEGKENNPNEGSVAYNEENVKPVDGADDLVVEKVKSENKRFREKSEPPADFLSGILKHS